MKSVAVLAMMVASAAAFVPSTPINGKATASRSSGSSLQMAKKAPPPPPVVSRSAVDGLVGFDIETGGQFDPLGFGRNCPPEQMQWYRAAELKHGRICMLAALGQFVQSYGIHWNDPSGVFDNPTPWAAMQQVYEQRPLAFVQIFLAIFAAEVWTNKQQELTPNGGDLGWDPLGLRPSEPEAWEKAQLRELKNGRLAMLGVAGMIAQESITHTGVLQS